MYLRGCPGLSHVQGITHRCQEAVTVTVPLTHTTQQLQADSFWFVARLHQRHTDGYMLYGWLPVEVSVHQIWPGYSQVPCITCQLTPLAMSVYRDPSISSSLVGYGMYLFLATVYTCPQIPLCLYVAICNW